MSAACNFLTLEHTSGAVHIGGQQHFFPLGAQLRHEIRTNAVVGVQFVGKLLHFRHIRLIAVEQGKAQVQQLRRARTNAFNRLQFVLSRFEHRVQRAKPLHQPVCCRVGIALPHCKIEQHLQHLVVAENLQAEPAEFVQHALAMTNMRVVWHSVCPPFNLRQ